MLRRVMMAGGALPPATYLDELAVQPQTALSLEKLISTATDAIRVRRSSDSAEQDIGFSGDDLDTAALAAFVGSNSAYVVTVYDQTGGGFNADQTTAAYQPRIVSSGIYDGAMMFDGLDDCLIISSLTAGTQYKGVYARAMVPLSATYRMAFESGPDSGLSNGGFGFFANADGALYVAQMRGVGNGGRSETYAMDISSMKGLSVLYDRATTGSNEIMAWLDGSEESGTPSGTGEQTGNFVSHPLYIGARTGSSLFSNMGLSSIVLYNADTSSIRANIEAIVA